MTTHRTYPHGVPCWVDTSQPDADAASRFYAPPVRLGVDRRVAVRGTWPAPDRHARRVRGRCHRVDVGGHSDLEHVHRRRRRRCHGSRRRGGRWDGLSGPVDAGHCGRAATCVDPAGARFHLWLERRRPGAQLVNAPGTWNFSDLHTPDRAAAMAFYRPLFGWVAADLAIGAGTMLQVPGYGDHLAATVDPGIHERQGSAPDGFADVIGGLIVSDDGESAHWHVTFAVADRDDTVATAERLGATVVTSGDDVWTRQALLRDPQGAAFTVGQFTPPDGDW